jgi:hypothetical protein
MRKFIWGPSTTLLLLLLGSLSWSTQFGSRAQAQSNSAKVITLTQTGCQFVETESKDYKFTPKKAQDCQKINADTLSERQKSFKTMSLPPGEYIFKVTNKNVPYELGFYLRGQGASQVVLPKLSGGGLTQGTTKEYAVNLKKGKYYISCPLNPTPDYTLIVQ